MRCARFQLEMSVGGYKISTKVEYGNCKGYVYILAICAAIFRFRTIKLDRGEITNKRLYILLRRKINCVYWVSVCFFSFFYLVALRCARLRVYDLITLTIPHPFHKVFGIIISESKLLKLKSINEKSKLMRTGCEALSYRESKYNHRLIIQSLNSHPWQQLKKKIDDKYYFVFVESYVIEIIRSFLIPLMLSIPKYKIHDWRFLTIYPKIVYL